MSETLTARLSVNLQATLENPLALSTPMEGVAQNIVNIIGGTTGRLFTQQGTVLASGTANIDLFAFAGAKDTLGRTYALTGIKLVLVQNLNASGDDVLLVGSGDGSAGWYSGFGDTSQSIAVRGGGMMLMAATDAAGYTVLSSATDGILKLTNNSGNPITYNIFVVGKQ